LEKEYLEILEKQRGRSFTLDSQTYHKDNGVALRYRKVKSENNNNEYRNHQNIKSRQLTEGRRAKSLKDRKMSPPRIIFSNEHKNLKYDDVILQYGNSPDDVITSRNLRQMSITSSEDSNPDILHSSLNLESYLRPHERFYQGLRHSSCNDLTTLVPTENENDLRKPNMGGHCMGRLMLTQQDKHMTSSHRNLNELNVRNTEQRKKSCSHIQNLELKKRVIEARVKARKRGETLKQLDDDFLKVRDFMKRYKSQDTLFDHNNNESHETSRKETLKNDSTKSKKDDKRHSWIT